MKFEFLPRSQIFDTISKGGDTSYHYHIYKIVSILCRLQFLQNLANLKSYFKFSFWSSTK